MSGVGGFEHQHRARLLVGAQAGEVGKGRMGPVPKVRVVGAHLRSPAGITSRAPANWALRASRRAWVNPVAGRACGSSSEYGAQPCGMKPRNGSEKGVCRFGSFGSSVISAVPPKDRPGLLLPAEDREAGGLDRKALAEDQRKIKPAQREHAGRVTVACTGGRLISPKAGPWARGQQPQVVADLRQLHRRTFGDTGPVVRRRRRRRSPR